MQQLAETINIPAKFIFAENYNKQELWSPWLKFIPVAYETAVIEGAGHTFTEAGKAAELYDQTLQFLLK